MEIFGWITFVVVALYMTAAGWLAIVFGGPGLSPLQKGLAVIVFFVMTGVWWLVWLSCPFSVQLNQ